MVPAKDDSLQIEVKRAGLSAVIALHGSAGIYEADRISEPMKALAEDKVRTIVLDLKDLSFIGSAGLGAIVAGYLKTRRNDGEVKLVAPQQAVFDELERTRLLVLFSVYPSVEAALGR